MPCPVEAAPRLRAGTHRVAVRGSLGKMRVPRPGTSTENEMKTKSPSVCGPLADYRHGLLREVAESPSLVAFRKRVDVALSDAA